MYQLLEINPDKLDKEELVNEISKRGEDVRGTKAVLREKLEQILKEEAMDGGNPLETEMERKISEMVVRTQTFHSPYQVCALL